MQSDAVVCLGPAPRLEIWFRWTSPLPFPAGTVREVSLPARVVVREGPRQCLPPGDDGRLLGILAAGARDEVVGGVDVPRTTSWVILLNGMRATVTTCPNEAAR